MMKQKTRHLLIKRGSVKLKSSYRRLQLVFALLVLHWGALDAESPADAIGNIAPGPYPENRQSINHDSASRENPGNAPRQDGVLSREEYKIAIITKNIFRPAKSITALGPEENITGSLGPEPLRSPFELLGIRETEQGRRADLAFTNPTPRVEEVAVGHVIENDVVTIIAIEPTFIRCKFLSSGSDVRISVNETSTDAWKRLSSNKINYVLLGTVETDNGYEAHIKVVGEDDYRTVEVGDMLGDATVTIIDQGFVLLIDGDGNEISIRAPLLSQWS